MRIEGGASRVNVRISLVTPSYNQAPFLEATLESVVAQKYPALEWIVMDGGSTDGSVEILKRYAHHFAYWTSERDAGQTDALQRGFARATGEILGWLNSDDVLLPHALERVGMFFAETPACDFLTGDSVFVSADGTRETYAVRGGAYSFRELLHYCDGTYLGQPSVFFSRAAFERVGGLDGTIQNAMDFDLWLRLREWYELFYLPQRLSQMREHPHAKGQDPQQRVLNDVVRVTKRYWGRVSAGERVGLWVGLHRMQAREDCKQGLARVAEGDLAAARRALTSAVRRYPPIVGERQWQRLFKQTNLDG